MGAFGEGEVFNKVFIIKMAGSPKKAKTAFAHRGIFQWQFLEIPVAVIFFYAFAGPGHGENIKI